MLPGGDGSAGPAAGLSAGGASPPARLHGWQRKRKAALCAQAWPFSHGTVLRSPHYPAYWELNCIRVERTMDADGMIAAAEAALADCPHRLADWELPMPDEACRALRARGWMVTPLVWMLHDGTTPPAPEASLIEVDFDAVRVLRRSWHAEDFGDHEESPGFHEQARVVAERMGARVIAVREAGEPAGFAQIEVHSGASEVAQVYVRPGSRGRGLGRALTTRAIAIAAASTPDVWICAERDDRPRRLYERLGFRLVAETASAIRPPGA